MMIPKLNSDSNIDELYLSFLNALKKTSYSGELCSDYASRLALSTDNSIYQVLPQAVLFPKCHDDLVAITSLANDNKFHNIVLVPRGGGTGTNAQSLSDGIVVDLSKHMNNILEINPEERWVRVQTGVVKDQLNAALKAHGLFFAPDLSTSNRATIGGMINTDASGQGSCLYGKTRDHVLQLHTVLMEGSTLVSYAVDEEDFKVFASNQDRSGQAYRLLSNIFKENQQAINEKFPQLNRCLTGYDLKHIYDEKGHFNLNNIICGSEGTLGFVTEAKLNVLPIPQHSTLVVVKYSDFESSLRDAGELMKTGPSSIETIDSKVLNLAMNDFVWHRVEQFFNEEDTKRVKGVNFVEYTSDDEKDLDKKVQGLIKLISNKKNNAKNNNKRIGYSLAQGKTEVNSIWAMRKQAVGLLGNSQGEARPIPFVEDTAVPPENLADFIMAFRKILDSYELQYGMFGHVDAGVLHVRPAIDMKNPESEKIAWEISDKVAKLCSQYKGLLWGEHGKGVRSQYAPLFFGDLYTQLQRIKQVFDPHNQLNPGKIATPKRDIPLLQIDQLATRGQQDRLILKENWQAFPEAVYCNGNGACFNWNTAEVMCPSWKGTRNRIHSPKGRATLFRDWLKLLSQNNIYPALALTSISAKQQLLNLPRKLFNTYSSKEKVGDFNREVYEAMAGCLSCKSCAGQCPINVDVPEFKSRFLALYHTRYLRPAKDYLVGSLEFVIPKLLYIHAFYNGLMRFPPVTWLLKNTIGFVDGPLLSGKRLANMKIDGEILPLATASHLNGLSEAQKQTSVVIVQDAFTSYFEAQVVIDTVKLLRLLGYQPKLAPFQPNGKPLQVHGFLQGFAKVASSNAGLLNSISDKGLPLIGVDPSMTYTYRSEYKSLLGDKKAPKVELMQDWLSRQLSDHNHNHNLNNKLKTQLPQKVYRLLPHCIESSHASPSLKAWAQIFSNFGQRLEVLQVGCCGMSGTYGHEKRNLATSKKIYKLSWQEAIEASPPELTLATGYSCRSQVKRESQRQVKHPIQALLHLLEQHSNEKQ